VGALSLSNQNNHVQSAVTLGVQHYTVETGDTSWSAIVRNICDGNSTGAAATAFSRAATGKSDGTVFVGQIIHVNPSLCPLPPTTTTISPTTIAPTTSTLPATTTTAAASTTTASPTTSVAPATTTTTIPPAPDAITHGRELTLNDVGPRAPPTGATFNSRLIVTTPGVILSGQTYLKGLTINADNVTVEDCVIRDTVNSDWANLIINGRGVTIQHCDIDNTSTVYYGIQINGDSTSTNPTKIHRNHIHHGGHGVNSDALWWEFTENLVDNIVAPNPPPYPGDDVWHADGIIAWGAHYYIARNKILVPLTQTGVINIGTWSGSQNDVDDVRIIDNYFAGAGFIFYIEEKQSSYNVTNMVITGNDIGQDFFPNGGYWTPGIWFTGYPPDVDPTVSGNRLVTATGAFVANIGFY